MNEKTKNVLLGVLIVGLVSMTVAYAALTQTLNINGSATVQNINSSWRVRFNTVNSGSEIAKEQYALVQDNATSLASYITSDSTLITLPRVTLKAPGDKVTFRWIVENTGDINAIITGVNAISKGSATYADDETLTAEQRTKFENDIRVTFTYDDDTAIAVGNKLANHDSKVVKAVVEFVKTSETQTLPSKDVTFGGITAAITYGQDTAA